MPDQQHISLAPAIDEIVAEIELDLVALRRDIHAYPEIGFDTHRTADLVAGKLRALGLQVQEGVGRTGLVTDIHGGDEGPCIILRADMDALHIHERTGLPFSSKIDGCMHACGHDLHSAALVGAAAAIVRLKEHLRGTVRLVFQPAEETVESGAAAMIADGVLEGVDAAIGFHNWPQFPAREIHLTKGASLASGDEFRVVVKGKSGHAAEPQDAMDPIVGAASLIMQLQTLVSRRMKPSDPFVFSIGQIAGGHSENIIPDECSFSGTVRCHSIEARDMVEQAFKTICEDGARALGLKAAITYQRGVPPLLNDPALVAQGERILSDQFGRQMTAVRRSEFGSEDFAYFSERVPSLHLFVGSGQPGRKDRLHNSDYQPDESSIGAAARALARLAFDLRV